MRTVLIASLAFAGTLFSTPLLWSDGATPTAEYTVTFDATWSAATHPVSFPPSPHFSGLIGGTHNASVTFWMDGGIASQGIENMAETGSKVPLDAEVQAAITAGDASSLISGGGIGLSPGSVATSFPIERDFPLVTLVSMIAPSPDWFVGVNSLSLFENGNWVAQKIVQLLPYDAGTDSGPSYTSPNQDTNPQDPIAVIVAPPAGNGVPFGTFMFTRTDFASVPTTSPLAVAMLAVFLVALAIVAVRRRNASATR